MRRLALLTAIVLITFLLFFGFRRYFHQKLSDSSSENTPSEVLKSKPSLPATESLSFSRSTHPDESVAQTVRPHSKTSRSQSLRSAEIREILRLQELEHIEARSSIPCMVVRHTYYLLCYVEAHEQPSWTAYILDGQKLKEGHLRRTQDFREDPKVATQSATLSDYRRSGYDRGHLVPAGDFKWDSIGMSETFYLSNMSPQKHEFNAGIWEAIERTVRNWAKPKGLLVVYTGPLLRPNLKKIGQNVSIPDTFYKVIYTVSGKEVQAVAFLVPHRPFPENRVARFMVSVDSVEKVTGIDFFPALPDDMEEKAESRWDKSQWPVRFTKR